MMRALLSVRFRALATMFFSRGGKKKSGTGTTILFVFLFLYLGAVMCGMSGFLFYYLSGPYHALGLEWLYFAMAGMMSLAMAVIGSVFTTQNQLYDAKDNPLLLSMPIRPSRILLSRMLPLLTMNLLFVSIVMGPAVVVYAVFINFQLSHLLLQLVSIPVIALLAQAIACLSGWLLHLLMSRLNKSLASILFTVVFLCAYFGIYSNANKLLTMLVANSQILAETLSAWIWPIYAMGIGCIGSLWHTLGFIAICMALFLAAYCVLSNTFLHAATASYTSRSARRLELSSYRSSSALWAIIRKELGKFIASPVYLTNMGLGILLCPVLAVCGILFQDKVISIVNMIMLPPDMAAMCICAMLSFLVSTMCISTPSISLEGKNLWILKSIPLSAAQILKAKLSMHILLSIPVTAITGLVLAITYHCSPAGMLFCVLIPSLLALLNGLLGMVTGLKWARFDYQNDAYPCKQSISILVSMFGMMGIPLGLGLLYGFVLYEYISAIAFLALSAVILFAICAILYRLMITWGIKQWHTF